MEVAFFSIIGIWEKIFNLLDENLKIFKSLNAWDKNPQIWKKILYLEKTLYLKKFHFCKKSLNLKNPNPQDKNPKI